MKFGKTLVIAVASLGMLASGLSAQADAGPNAGTTTLGGSSVMPHGMGASPPPALTTQPVNNPGAAPEPSVQQQPPTIETQQPPQFGEEQQGIFDRWPDEDNGLRGRPGRGHGGLDLKGCRCTNLELYTPKEKTAEAFLFDDGPSLRFVEVRVAIGHRVRCTPVNPFEGCAAYLVIDKEGSGADWNGGVVDLHTLPLKLGCPGKCDGNWHSGESYLVYYGWVLGAWPSAGIVHFKVVGTGCDEVQDADIWATVTFSGTPGATVGVVSGTVVVDYAFSGSHIGY